MAERPQRPETEPPLPFHYYVDGEVWRPLDRVQVQRFVSQARLTADSFVWRPGTADWVRVRSCPDLLAAFPDLAEQADDPPPLPRLVIEEMNQYANFAERLSAMSIDSFLLQVIGLLAYAAVTPFVRLEALLAGPVTGDVLAAAIGGQLWALSRLIGFALVYAILVAPYFIWLMSERGLGQTIGCRVMKIRLVDEDSRDLVGFQRLVPWYLGTLLIPIGWITYFTDDKRRMLHNILSGTIMIRSEPRL